MSMTPLKMTFGSPRIARRARPIAARHIGSLALVIAIGLFVAVTLAVAPAVRTTGYHPGAHGRVNAVAGGRLIARDHAATHPAPATVSGPASLASATVAGPATVSGPASRTVAAGRGTRSLAAIRHLGALRRIAATSLVVASTRHAMIGRGAMDQAVAEHLAPIRRHTAVTGGRTRAGGPALGLGRAATTVSAASVALGIAVICALFIAVTALAVAIPTPSGGARRSADVARLEHLSANRSLSQRRAA